jgi:hypothetical protein
MEVDSLPPAPGYKRKRSAPAKRAYWASKKFGEVQPWSTHGAMRVERGTERNLRRFGETYKKADAQQKIQRRAMGYTGRGSYIGALMRGAQLFGKYAPAIAEGVTGIGSAYRTGQRISGRGLYTGRQYVGRGEYSQNNLIAGGAQLHPPKFQSSGDETGALMVTHREYVGDIFAPGSSQVSDFVVQSFPINPGLEQTFPWLSQIAQNYEEYELKQCVFEFQSTVQDINSNNGQVGTIIAATQYNPTAKEFTDKPAMAAYAHAVSGKSTDSIKAGVECDPSKMSGSAGKYIRANPVMTNEDLKTYDIGRFEFATHNIPASMASGTLGELYVYYTVCLRKPKFFTGRGLGLTRWTAVGGLQSPGSAGTSATNVFGTNPVYGLQNNIPIKMDTSTSGVVKLTFPAYYAGSIRLRWLSEGANVNIGETDVLTATGNVSVSRDMVVAGSSVTSTPDWYYAFSNASNRAMCVQHIRIEPATNAVDNSISVGIGAQTVPNLIEVDVTEYNTFGRPGEEQQFVDSGGNIVSMP